MWIRHNCLQTVEEIIDKNTSLIQKWKIADNMNISLPKNVLQLRKTKQTSHKIPYYFMISL